MLVQIFGSMNQQNLSSGHDELRDTSYQKNRTITRVRIRNNNTW